MTKKQWLYLGHQQKRSVIKLQHDERKGNLLITFNKEILLLDIKVFQPESYTFYIDDEVCKIVISRHAGRFQYHFVIDKQINTPLNRLRKKKFRMDFLKSAGLFGLIFLAIGAIFLGGYLYNKKVDTKSLKIRGMEATATFRIVDPGNFPRWRNVIYTYGGKDFTGFTNFYSKRLNKQGQIMLSNGFPLENDDEFIIRFDPIDPGHNYKIFYDRPSEVQLDRYRELATQRWALKNEGGSEAYCECLLDILYKQHGTKGLTAFYYQWTPKRSNRKFNEKLFQEIKYNPEYIEQEVHCWEFK